MSDETADHKKKELEELALEAGVYLSPERLSTTEQRLKDEKQRRSTQATEGGEQQHDQKPIERGAPRPVGRPRGSRSAPTVGEKQPDNRPEAGPEKQKKELYMVGPRMRRFF
jgi:hypothetical protein